MVQKEQIVAFEGGALRRLSPEVSGREAVLALPLGRMLVRMVRVPPEVDAGTVAQQVLQAASPFPDETPTAAVEEVSESAAGKVVIAAALPESAAEDIGEALDAAKVNVNRVDALVFGRLRRMWDQIGAAEGVRRLVVFKTTDGLECIVLDEGLPCAIRALDAACDIMRETMLLLLEAEDFAGSRDLSEVVIVVPPDLPEEEKARLREAFGSFGGGLRILLQDADAGLVGVQERAAEAGTLDALPESWREVLMEERFKRKLCRNLLVAGAVMALALGVLFGVPIAYGYRTDYQKGLSREHSRKYAEVREMKAKTEIVKKYSDHTRGALEVMKTLSDRLPGGAELTSWNYRREDGVTVVGEADSASAVYDFKDAMEAVAFETDDGEAGDRVFPVVDLTGPNASRNGQRFTLSCGYAKEDAE